MGAMSAATPVTRDAKPRQSRRRRLAIAMGLALVTLGVPTGFWLWSSWAHERELAEALAETERLDPRWRFRDILADRKPITDEDNPAIILARVDTLLKRGRFSGETKLQRLEDLPSVNQLDGHQIAVLREALMKHAEAVEMARTLIGFPCEARFALPIDMDSATVPLGIEEGQWPVSLAELAKGGWIAAVPLDPFDGQPLRYKRVPDGVLIYSVGLDGVDDGGVINRENPIAPGTDQGFRLWSPIFRRQAPLPAQPDDDGGPR
jgi:hypothetical protein